MIYFLVFLTLILLFIILCGRNIEAGNKEKKYNELGS